MFDLDRLNLICISSKASMLIIDVKIINYSYAHKLHGPAVAMDKKSNCLLNGINISHSWKYFRIKSIFISEEWYTRLVRVLIILVVKEVTVSK